MTTPPPLSAEEHDLYLMSMNKMRRIFDPNFTACYSDDDVEGMPDLESQTGVSSGDLQCIIGGEGMRDDAACPGCMILMSGELQPAHMLCGRPHAFLHW